MHACPHYEETHKTVRFYDPATPGAKSTARPSGTEPPSAAAAAATFVVLGDATRTRATPLALRQRRIDGRELFLPWLSGGANSASHKYLRRRP